jgi:hypothetical protein
MTLDYLPPQLRRTVKCGEFRQSHAGQNVVAMGWVARRRDLGSLIFIDLRDRAGVLQVVFNQEANAALHKRAEDLRSEFVIAVEGKIIQRARLRSRLKTACPRRRKRACAIASWTCAARACRPTWSCATAPTLPCAKR